MLATTEVACAEIYKFPKNSLRRAATGLGVRLVRLLRLWHGATMVFEALVRSYLQLDCVPSLRPDASVE
ncbi:MAG: hypothetical protein C4289_14465 [Chloroflexota bacterium]